MDQEQIDKLIRENGGPFIFDRMFSAVEKVKERLERACKALNESDVPYAVIGGNAVAAWVATVDEGAVRNTRDVDILLNKADIDAATAALSNVGFHRDQAFGVTVFLDGPDGVPSQGLHVIWSGEKVHTTDEVPAPAPGDFRVIEGKRIVDLEGLVRMKLVANRDKDRVHIRDMIGVGLFDESWLPKFPGVLAGRLQELLDDPDG